MSVDVFSLVSEHLPSSARVLAFHGEEGISRLYRFEILFVVPRGAGADFELSSTLLQRATLAVQRPDGSRRTWWHGVLASVEYVHEHADDVVYRAVLVPRLFLLSLVTHHRAWVQGVAPDRIPDIVQAILREHGINQVEAPLQRAYRSMLQVVQYGETDLDFVSRWMEREGLYYFFTQGESAETVLITDSHLRHPEARAQVRYFASADDDTAQTEAMEAFRARVAATAQRFQVRDYDDQHVAVQSAEAAAAPWGRGTSVRWGGGLGGSDTASRQAEVRAGEALAGAVRYHGRGRLFDLRPGYFFDLEEHPRAAYNTRYLCVGLRHEGNQFAAFEGLVRSMGLRGGRTYRVEVEAIEATVQYRAPAVTPTPRVYGVESAVVDGPADSSYAQMDDQGRYRVKMHFDEGALTGGRASLWVRMLQPHGGGAEGIHFPLRKGTEVMLVFLGGDPDRPVIAGAAPNPRNPSQVTADNGTHNVIQTGGRNRIEMEDLRGAERIDVSTPTQRTQLHLGAHHGAHAHNWMLRTEGNGLLHTDGDEDVYVGGELREHAVGLVTETYDDNHNTAVAGDQNNRIAGSQHTRIAVDQNTRVTGNQTVGVRGDQSTEVTGDQTVRVTGTQRNTVTGDQVTSVRGAQLTSVDGGQTTQVAGNRVTTVMGNQTQSVRGSHTATYTGPATVNAPAGYRVIAPAGAEDTSSKWFKLTGVSVELAGAKMTGFIAKVDVGGLSFSGVATKIDLAHKKFDNDKLRAHFSQVRVAQSATNVDSGGVRLLRAIATLFV